MPNQENLKKGKNARWKKGQSGNPKGRPKNEACITPIMRKMAGEICPEDRERRTWGVVIVERMFREAAISGNVAAAKEIIERLDGKVKQDLGLGGFDGGPIEMEILSARNRIARELARISARKSPAEDSQ